MGGAVAGGTRVPACAPTFAWAQIDPEQHSFAIYQNERQVGEIYREDTDPAHYVEHWVPFAKGAHYVKVDCGDGEQLPGR